MAGEKNMDNSELKFEVENLKKSMTHLYDSFKDLVSKFDGLFARFDSVKQPPDLKTILLVILATITITSSLFATASWLIKSEMNVPLEHVALAKADIQTNANEIDALSRDVQSLVTTIESLSGIVAENGRFVNQYTYIDKVPVQTEIQNGRINMLEIMLRRLTDKIHSAKITIKD